MGYLSLAGLRGQKLSSQTLRSTRSSANSDRWKWVAADLVCQLTASLRSVAGVASILGRFRTKLASWCFKVFSVFSWFYTYVAFRSFSWQHWLWGVRQSCIPSLFGLSMGLLSIMKKWMGQVVEVGADVTGGGKPTCIRIGYSSQETRRVFQPCIKIGYSSAMY